VSIGNKPSRNSFEILCGYKGSNVKKDRIKDGFQTPKRSEELAEGKAGPTKSNKELPRLFQAPERSIRFRSSNPASHLHGCARHFGFRLTPVPGWISPDALVKRQVCPTTASGGVADIHGDGRRRVVRSAFSHSTRSFTAK